MTLSATGSTWSLTGLENTMASSSMPLIFSAR